MSEHQGEGKGTRDSGLKINGSPDDHASEADCAHIGLTSPNAYPPGTPSGVGGGPGRASAPNLRCPRIASTSGKTGDNPCPFWLMVPCVRRLFTASSVDFLACLVTAGGISVLNANGWWPCRCFISHQKPQVGATCWVLNLSKQLLLK